MHASCVALDGGGVLILGPPGSGKSTLALVMIERGARLVADDQVQLAAEHGRLRASAPPVAAGVLEIAGFGVVRLSDWASHAAVDCALQLQPAGVDRLSEPVPMPFCGVRLPVWPVSVDNPHSGMKAIAFLRAWRAGRVVECLPVASPANSA